MTDFTHNNISVTAESGVAKITGVLPVEQLESHRAKALDFFRENINLDGFRKGNIPDEVLKKNVPEPALYEHMAEIALNDIYPSIIEENKLQVIGRPSVQFTKVVPEQPIEFTIETALMPDVNLPDYKAVAKELGGKQEEIEVTDEEVERSILEVRKMLAQKRAESKSAETKEPDDEQAEEAQEEAQTENDSEDENKKKNEENTEEEPPELTDEDVKELGQYNNVEEFKKGVREDLKRYKAEQEDEKRRVNLADTLVEKSDITIPSMLAESEMRSMEAQFEENLKRSGFKKEDYLKHVNKTEEDLKKEWYPEAEKRAKLQLILNKIASEENISPDKEAVKQEVDSIVSHDSSIPRDRAEAYVESTHRNKAVFDFLENQKEEKR